MYIFADQHCISNLPVAFLLQTFNMCMLKRYAQLQEALVCFIYVIDDAFHINKDVDVLKEVLQKRLA